MMEFREETHEYIRDNEPYLSVTTFISQFQEYVDWKEVAYKKAMREGLDPDALYQEWQNKRDKAAKKGTDFHKMMEDYLVGKGHRKENDKIYPICNTATIDGIKVDTVEQLSDNTVYVEKMIWSKKHKICGTADLVEVVNGVIHIKDYKTNEKIPFESYKDRRKGSKRLLPPLKHLDDCKGNLYQLQLNMYMYMLLQQNPNLKMGTMTLLHIIFDEEGKPKEVRPIPVGNLQKEIKSILKTRK